MAIQLDSDYGISSTGNITTDGYVLGNGALLTGISGGNVNLTAVTTNIIPTGNNTQSLGNATHQWQSLYVSSNTIYFNSVPLSVTANSTLTIAGQPVVTTGPNAAPATGNISTTAAVNANTVVANSLSISGNVNLTNIVSNSITTNSLAVLTTFSANTFTANTFTANRFIANIANVNNTLNANSILSNSIVSGNIDATIVVTGGPIPNPENTNYGVIVQGANARLRVGPYTNGVDTDYLDIISSQGANYAGIQTDTDSLDIINLSNVGVVSINTNSGSLPWVFDATGNITLPGNTSSINYANGQPYTTGNVIGNGVAGGPVTSIQFNAGNNSFGGTGNITTDGTNLTVAGNINTSAIIGNSGVGQVVIIPNSAFSSDYWEFRTHPTGAPDGSISSALHVPPSDGPNISAIHFPGLYGGGYIGWYNVNSWANSLTLISTNAVSITTEAQGGIPGETQWLFDPAGNLTLPALTGAAQTISLTTGGVGYTTANDVPTDSGTYGNGHGMTLNIVADTGNSNAVLSAVINNPGQGYANGAVITIAQPSSTGTATVTVNVVGNGSPSINYANGQPYGGSGGSNYGNANVAAYLPTYTGNISNLTFGSGADIVGPNSGNGSSYLKLMTPSDTRLGSDDGNVEIWAGAPSKIYSFGADGTLTLPDLGLVWNNGGITTLQAGNNGAQIGSNDGQSYVIANVDGTYMQTLADTTNSLWHFGTDGNLTAPGSISAASFVTSGAQGNITGAFAITANYLLGDGSNITNVIASTANTAFIYNSIYNVNGPILENANLTLSGTAALLLPSNGNTDPIQLNNLFGNVTLRSSANGAGGIQLWNFSNDGSLTVPGQINGTANSTVSLMAMNGGDAPSAQLMNWEIANAAPSTLISVDQDSFIVATNLTGIANGTPKQWTFDNVGNLTLPTNSLQFNYANGSPVSFASSTLANSTATFTLLSDNTLLSGTVASPQNFKINDAYTPDVDLRNASGTGMFTQGPSVTVRTAGTYNWQFGSDGTLNLPLSTSPGNSLIQSANNIVINSNSNLWSFDTTGNLTAPGEITAAGNITASSLSLTTGQIQSGVTTIVNDGINSITLDTVTQMDVFAFPFTTVTRGVLNISGITSTTQANGTWYYESINTNTFVIYTDGTYTTPVDSTTWDPYLGGGVVDFVENLPAGNLVLNANGFLSTFTSNGQLELPGDVSAVGNVVANGNIVASNFNIVKSGYNVQYPLVTLNNVKAAIDGTGNPTFGAVTTNIFGSFTYQAQLWNGTNYPVTTGGSNSTAWTTAFASGLGVTFANTSDQVVAYISDDTDNHLYKVTWIAGSSGPATGYGFVEIEQLA